MKDAGIYILGTKLIGTKANIGTPPLGTMGFVGTSFLEDIETSSEVGTRANVEASEVGTRCRNSYSWNNSLHRNITGSIYNNSRNICICRSITERFKRWVEQEAV